MKYSLIRLGIFIIVLAIMLILQVNPFLSAIVAAVAGFTLAYIFFRPLRDQMAAELAARRAKPEAEKKDADALAEDLD